MLFLFFFSNNIVPIILRYSYLSDIKTLIGFESSIFELSTFILGKGKREKNH